MDEVITDEPKVHAARVIEPAPANLTKYEQKSHAGLGEVAALEDDIYAKSHQVIKDVLAFRDVDPEDKESEENTVSRWVSEGMDREEARKRFRLATSGWYKASEAPMGVALAKDMFASITKARSKETTQHIHLTANYVVLPAPTEYPEQIEEDVDDG